MFETYCRIMPPIGPPCMESGIFDMSITRVPSGSSNRLFGWSPRSTSLSVIRIGARAAVGEADRAGQLGADAVVGDPGVAVEGGALAVVAFDPVLGGLQAVHRLLAHRLGVEALQVARIQVAHRAVVLHLHRRVHAGHQHEQLLVDRTGDDRDRLAFHVHLPALAQALAVDGRLHRASALRLDDLDRLVAGLRARHRLGPAGPGRAEQRDGGEQQRGEQRTDAHGG
ncbi:MAG: hypothetical protein U5L06_10310 [Rhodovibrio sp.]|nr:hypothetical protein [Rhodovibrio sp.]